MTNQSLQPLWWEPYHDILPASLIEYWAAEAQARQVHVFCPLFLPGLLQTEAYTRALILPNTPLSSGSTLQEIVEARMKRQWHVFERPDPVEYHAIIDEAVLSRQVGGPAVMYEQLQYIRKLIEMPNITLHIAKWHEGSDWQLLYFAGVCTLIDGQLWREDYALGMIKNDDPFVASSYQGHFRRVMRGAMSPEASRRYLEECIAKLA